MKKALFVLFVLLMSISACSSYENCMRKHGQIAVDTNIVYFHKTIPKDSIVIKTHIDSIKPDSVYSYSSDRATIKYWKDKYNNMLYMQADCDSIVITDTLEIIQIRNNFVSKETKPYWQSTKAFLLMSLILIAIIIVLIKIKK